MPRPRTPRHLQPASLPAALERLDRRLGDNAVRLVATAVAGLILLTAGAAAGVSAPERASTAVNAAAATTLIHEVAPQPIVLAPQPSTARRAALPHTGAKRTASLASPARLARHAAPRWLPTGTGMWLHQFSRSEGGNARAVVARARRAGLSTLYVQTGSTKKGWIGSPSLKALLRATKGTDIKVVAWDFPHLAHPAADARRLALAIRYRCNGCARVAAVAPDVETASEGTRLSPLAIKVYYTELRRLIGPSIAILATVPWPSEMRIGKYPYAQTAKLSDAMLPMAYWYNRSPAVVTRTSMAYLRRFHKPVMPVGQGYDGRMDAPYLPADPTPGLSVLAFLTAAKHSGAQHVSLWSWQTTGPQQWQQLALASRLFPAKRVGAHA